ncbi:hypothetical protein ACVIHI_001623 [Bradyrhizobium sp. USDA 4524]|uniref:hypothetical protein n=1 Tax=unclassified Bradyrhizobium TaxID=2631580 RepID=UPI0020A1FE24|nr:MULTISPECIES: hypothetical protein [unclassified Bradyrhizobium]MCP1845457.1 hypothetical protein [Bradyrhizobium sp. USDA 4538]MCP1906021.1 hypothetical protein [Bradyrhizobium sp. USDA 4537]MCP1988324.1 hypothetical protein [Bradyrhizobium sp. USDA 4539]
MAAVWKEQSGGEGATNAVAIASQILARADRDVTFVVQLLGESQNLLVRHFIVFIEVELAKRDISYGAHPLLRPFVETHARELSEFVLKGIGLRHQFGLQVIETMAGDPARLLRVDLWDSLQSHINDAQQHFVSGVGGLQRILTQIEADS